MLHLKSVEHRADDRTTVASTMSHKLHDRLARLSPRTRMLPAYALLAVVTALHFLDRGVDPMFTLPIVYAIVVGRARDLLVVTLIAAGVQASGGSSQEVLTATVGALCALTAGLGVQRLLARIRERHERLELVLGTLEEGVVVQDADGAILRANAAAGRILGLGEDELLGRRSIDPRWRAIREDGTDWPGSEHPAMVALATGRPQLERVMGVHRPDGSLRWVSINARPMASGGVVCSFVDITARKVAADRVAASEAKLFTITANAPVGLFEIDLEGRCSWANPRWGQIAGIAPEDAHGRRWVETLHPDERMRALRDMVVMADRQERRFELALRFVRPDGTVVPTHVSADLVLGPDGAPAGYLGAVVDLTDRETALASVRESERHHRSIVRSLPDAAIFTYDLDLRITSVEGPEAEKRPQALESVGRPLVDVMPADRWPAVERELRAAGRGEARSFAYEAAVGSSYEVEAAPLRDDAGSITGILAVWRNVDAKVAERRARREAEERFRTAFDRAPIGMAVLDLEGRFEEVNAAFAAIAGLDREALLDCDVLSITHPEDRAGGEEAFAAFADGRRDDLTVEHRILRPDGRATWVSVHGALVRDGDGRPQGVLAQVQDISERRSFERRLRHLADHDPLTGLVNRRGFEAALHAHVARCRRYGAQGALLMLDLDGFKHVNDALGHAAGDEVIVTAAGTLARRLRETDVVARLGGDEFAVLLSHGDERGAMGVAESLRAELAARLGVDGLPGHRITASIGVVTFEHELLEGDAALVHADLAMYAAKDAGRDAVRLFSREASGSPRLASRLEWVDRISRALDEDGFALMAQPIVRLPDREATQFEVLVRMVADDGDLIPPAAFLPAAERFGLAPRLDRWVVTKAIAAMAQASSTGRRIVLEVNLSGASLGDPELLEAIESELERTGVDPRDLIFEITETAAVSDLARAREFALRLRALGCRFALDDFGSGFGSFSYLKHLPFDFLKIDGEFVSGLRESRADRLVVDAVVGLARGMDASTVAEWVDDDDTARLLRERGVDYAQGFHLGRPEPLEQRIAALSPVA